MAKEGQMAPQRAPKRQLPSNPPGGRKLNLDSENRDDDDGLPILAIDQDLPAPPEDVLGVMRDMPDPTFEMNLADPDLYIRRLIRDQQYAPSVGFKICRGSECPFHIRCPLRKDLAERQRRNIILPDSFPSSLPIGEECPIERHLFSMYASGIARDQRVSFEEVVSMGHVKAIAWAKLEAWRAQQTAADAPPLIDSLRGISPQGIEITEPKLNPIFTLEEKIAAKQARFEEDLQATRKAKAKDKSQRTQDVNEVLQSTIGILKKLRDTGYSKERPVIERRGGIQQGISNADAEAAEVAEAEAEDTTVEIIDVEYREVAT